MADRTIADSVLELDVFLHREPQLKPMSLWQKARRSLGLRVPAKAVNWRDALNVVEDYSEDWQSSAMVLHMAADLIDLYEFTYEESLWFLDDMCKMLEQKNAAYGDSLAASGTFSKATPTERLKVQMDCKINRLRKGKEFAGDDTVLDLIGYCIMWHFLLMRGYK